MQSWLTDLISDAYALYGIGGVIGVGLLYLAYRKVPQRYRMPLIEILKRLKPKVVKW